MSPWPWREQAGCAGGLTSLLHEAEEVVQELLPPGVTVQLVQLHNKRRKTLRTPPAPAPPLPGYPQPARSSIPGAGAHRSARRGANGLGGVPRVLLPGS